MAHPRLLVLQIISSVDLATTTPDNKPFFSLSNYVCCLLSVVRCTTRDVQRMKKPDWWGYFFARQFALIAWTLLVAALALKTGLCSVETCGTCQSANDCAQEC